VFGQFDMKAAADRGGLNEMDADPVGRAPFDVAIPLDGFGPDQKREIVRDADRAVDFKRRAFVREIANDAIDAGREAENDRPAFERSVTRSASPFFHGFHRYAAQAYFAVNGAGSLA
jgi:hypothetical protein